MLSSIFLAVTIAAAANAADIVNYGAFTQTATFSIANQLGFFKAYDLDVLYQQVPNSTFAYANILSGGYDILTGTIDNAVNLRFNSNKTITVLGQLDQGPDLVLASVPGVETIAQLKGKPLIVDSPVSGYAYLLRKTVGGTNLRYADLIAGLLPNGTRVYGTILTYPFTAEGSILSAAQKPNVLARVSDIVNPISSSAFTTSQSTIEDSDKKELLSRFISAMYAANIFLQMPAKKNCSITAIQNQLGITATTAALEYAAATNAVSGEVSGTVPTFTVNQKGLQNIIAVRQEFGGFTTPGNFDFNAAIVPGKGKLIDYCVRDKAILQLNLSLLAQAC